MKPFRHKIRIPEPLIWPLVALFLLLVFNFLFTENFFHIEVRNGKLFGSLVDILDRAAPLMLVSLGMTLVIATGGVDLSVGAVMAITGTMIAGLLARPDFSILARMNLHDSFSLALCAALAAGIVFGSCNGILVSFFNIQPIVATLILMVAGRGIAQLLSNGQIVTVQNETFSYWGNGYFLWIPFTVFIVAIFFAATWLFVRKTALGLFVEACGSNPIAAHYSGIDIRMVKFMVYAFSGFCAGMAGILVAADIKAADANNAGLYLELDAILATVLGGTTLKGGRCFLAGSLVGAVLIQSVTTTILMRGVPVEYTLVVKSLVIVVICLLQSAEFRNMISSRLRRIGK